jgi:hypothetical protein
LIEALFDAQKDDHIKWNEGKKAALVTRISKVINDNCLVLNDKHKLVQANDCISCIALVSWLSSPLQFEQDKATSIEVYPSQQTMYWLLKKMI